MISEIGKFMVVFAKNLFAIFRDGAAEIVAKLLGTFGLTMISVKAILPELKSFIVSYVGAMPPVAREMWGAIGADVFISVVLSAVTIKFSMKFLIVPTSVVNSLRGG